MLTQGQRRKILAALLAAALGFGLWALSPMLLGTLEPWDGPPAFYILVLVFGGAALGYVFGPVVVVSFVGAWAGQVLALAVLPHLERDWFVLGIITTALGSIIIVPGVIGGARARRHTA